MLGVWLTRLLVLLKTLGLDKYLQRQAARLESKAAVSAAAGAKTPEEFQDASRKLSDAANTPQPVPGD